MGFMRFHLVGRFARWMSTSSGPSTTPQIEYADCNGVIYCDCNGVIYCGASS